MSEEYTKGYRDGFKDGFQAGSQSDEIYNIFLHSQEQKEVKTLSNLTSGTTKQGGVNAQDDTRLQFERSASLPVDNHPDNIHTQNKELIDKDYANPKQGVIEK